MTVNCKGKEYIVSVDDVWIGKYHHGEGGMNFYSPTVKCSVNAAQKLTKGIRGKIRIYATWGSWPEQRRVVKRLNHRTGRDYGTYEDYWGKE